MSPVLRQGDSISSDNNEAFRINTYKKPGGRGVLRLTRNHKNPHILRTGRYAASCLALQTGKEEEFEDDLQRSWGSVASTVIVTLPRGGGASDTGESPWRQLQERAQKIQGDKKHIEGMLSQSHCVAQFNTAHKPPGNGC
jgi:hypothetical protein